MTELEYAADAMYQALVEVSNKAIDKLPDATAAKVNRACTQYEELPRESERGET